MGANSRGVVVYGSRVRVDCSVFCAFDDVRVSLIFFCASFVFCFLDRSVPGVTKHPKMFPALSVQVCFSPLSPCKNGHPETTRNPSATRLRFQISLSSIDRCPPFRAKRTDRGGNNNRLKNLCNFFPAEPPPSRLVQDDGSRKLPQTTRRVCLQWGRRKKLPKPCLELRRTLS